METISAPKRPRLALLIDGENLSPRYAKEVLTLASGLGEVPIQRVFGDFLQQSTPPWDALVPRSLGIEPVQVQWSSAGCNSTDVAIMAEANELIEAGGMEGVCVASADGDFAPLAENAHAAGKLFFGIGPAHASRNLVRACDRFFVFPDTCKSAKLRSEQQLLHQAVAIHANKQGWAKLQAVSAYLRHRSSSYTEHRWGFATLSKVLRASGMFDVKQFRDKQMRTRLRTDIDTASLPNGEIPKSPQPSACS